MKALTWCVVGLVFLAIPALAQDQGTSGDTEQAVAALEQQWLKAQKTSNADILAPLLADRFMDTTADGKVMDKAATLDSLKGSKYENAEYTDVKVMVFGNTAIATGGFKGKVTDPAGKSVDANERWTDTWVKMPDGKWQCVASAAAPVKM